MGLISQTVGKNVKRLRERGELSQQDLSDRLEVVGAGWSRAAVGMLESKGIRGERLSDLASLCAALGTSLDKLLEPTPETGVDHSLSDPSPSWVWAALSGQTVSPTKTERYTQALARRPGQHSEYEAQRMARGLGVPYEVLQMAVLAISNQDSPTVLRDFLAEIDGSTSREEARVRRAKATRKLRDWIAHDPPQPMSDELMERFSAWLKGSAHVYPYLVVPTQESDLGTPEEV